MIKNLIRIFLSRDLRIVVQFIRYSESRFSKIGDRFAFRTVFGGTKRGTVQRPHRRGGAASAHVRELSRLAQRSQTPRDVSAFRAQLAACCLKLTGGYNASRFRERFRAR